MPEDRNAALFFIHTPLSYLCIREYVPYADGKELHLYVVARSRSAADQICQLATKDRWNSITIVLSGFRPGWAGKFASIAQIVRARHKLGAALASLKPQDTVVVSHLGNPYTRYVLDRCRRRCGEIVVVDDGTTTLIEYAALARDGALTMNNTPGRSKALTARIEEACLSSSPIAAGEVSYFSFWDLRDPGPKRLRRNGFALLRSELARYAHEDSVYFVGQPFVRRGLLSAEAYASIISRIAQHFAGKGLRFVYFPHRNEDVEAAGHGYELRYTDLPFELYIMRENALPRVIAGFYSACLITTKYILGDNVRHEVFWGFEAVAPARSQFPEIADAFTGEAERSASFLINTELGSARP